MKQAKKCNVCGKILGPKNKSGFCSHHYRMALFKRIKKERKEKHLCIDCGTKIKQTTKHYVYNTRPPLKTYPLRCSSCQKKRRDYARKFYHRPEVKERRKQYFQRDDVKERIKKYNQKPEVKVYKKAYSQRPEVKERRKKQRQEQRKKERLIKNK